MAFGIVKLDQQLSRN